MRSLVSALKSIAANQSCCTFSEKLEKLERSGTMKPCKADQKIQLCSTLNPKLYWILLFSAIFFAMLFCLLNDSVGKLSFANLYHNRCAARYLSRFVGHFLIIQFDSALLDHAQCFTGTGGQSCLF